MAEPFSTILGTDGSGGRCKYLNKGIVGLGSYGEAYVAESVEDGSLCVAKVMDLSKMSQRDKRYAQSEIKCLANCNHPNIIRYIEDHEENDRLLIVMEFADSGNLDEQIKLRGSGDARYFQEHEALFLFLQLCLALDYIHSHKMLHRDIKSANVLLTSTGLVKLGDFGFSHQYEDTVSGVVASTFCGTPYYLAPELWNNKRYNKKADVWSLGVLLYEIMGMKKPFSASNLKGLMSKVLAGTYAPLPDSFSSEFKRVVDGILVADPNDRPSVREIFQIPYINKGLKLFVQALKKNERISDSVKEVLVTQVSEILSSEVSPDAHRFLVSQINYDVTHRGHVNKLGGGNGKSWKPRFLQIVRGQLILTDDEEGNNPKGLNLEQVQGACPVPHSTAKRDFVFALNTVGGKGMWFQAVSHGDMEMWVHAIQRGIGVA
uniref:Putative serine/threonine-protein kinase A n=1 Tax=Trypanosoma brucei brucei TaxID=5702 RepID=NRKA_TRYBB|nr:RecName: Full=Putative serine/threonine-protein kinase A [Trypanosoma brucei brucei]AAB59252.1 protein kinase [Trypanosoma brucei]